MAENKNEPFDEGEVGRLSINMPISVRVQVKQ